MIVSPTNVKFPPFTRWRDPSQIMLCSSGTGEERDWRERENSNGVFHFGTIHWQSYRLTRPERRSKAGDSVGTETWVGGSKFHARLRSTGSRRRLWAWWPAARPGGWTCRKSWQRLVRTTPTQRLPHDRRWMSSASRRQWCRRWLFSDGISCGSPRSTCRMKKKKL